MAMKIHKPPSRIQDLVSLKQQGAAVSCRSYFDVIPMDFSNGDNSFQALMFLCQYSGAIDGEEYGFKKCYARGCPNNQCPNIYQAVMTAKQYVQMDYEKLEQSGIALERRRLTLEEIVANFEKVHAEQETISVIHDYIKIAESGNDVFIDPVLEFVHAGERFSDYTIQMIFLMVHFTITCPGTVHRHERCLACYPAEREGEEKQEKTMMANNRLKWLFTAFESASIHFEPKYF